MAQQYTQSATDGARAGLASLVSGTVAGVVAALACWAAQVLMRTPLPPARETAGSAVAAGIAGGALYYALTLLVRRPDRALLVLGLGIATLDSLLVILLPLPAGRWPLFGLPIAGLVVPIRQLAALIGVGHLSARHFPAALLPADTLLHYIPAVAVGTIVPWLARRRAVTT